MRSRSLTFALFLTASPAFAGPVDRAMLNLDPEERAHQACIIKGIASIRQDKSLPGVDRMKTGIFGRAEFNDDTHVVAHGGAVRANHHWYKLTFDCRVSADQMTATSFTYKLGAEIPKTNWEDLGLWD